MRFVVERDALSDGVAWVSRSLSSRPIMPVLLGVVIDAQKNGVHLAGYDLETSAKSIIAADVKEEGRVLVSGRLLSDIAKSLREKLAATTTITPPNVQLEQISNDGTRKWLVGAGTGNGVETVFIPEENRGTLCISTQAGCAFRNW